MNQEELAKKIGIPRTYLNGILNGNRIPSRKLAKRIGKAIGVNWLEFRPGDRQVFKEFIKGEK